MAMDNEHWGKHWWSEAPKELLAEIESQLNPDLPTAITAHKALPENAMLLIPNSNQRNLSPQEMIEQGDAVAAQVVGFWNEH